MLVRIQVARPVVASLLLVLGLTVQGCNGDDGIGGPTQVPPGPVPQQLAINPAAATLLVGESLQFQVTGAGVASGVMIEWTSSDPAVVMVSRNGLATGVGLGSATLSATRAGYAVTAQVSVLGRRQPGPALPGRRMERN